MDRLYRSGGHSPGKQEWDGQKLPLGARTPKKYYEYRVAKVMDTDKEAVSAAGSVGEGKKQERGKTGKTGKRDTEEKC